MLIKFLANLVNLAGSFNVSIYHYQNALLEQSLIKCSVEMSLYSQRLIADI